jgi:hypothetical protein
MFDGTPPEKPITLSLYEAGAYANLPPRALYDLLEAHRLPRLGGIPLDGLRRAINNTRRHQYMKPSADMRQEAKAKEPTPSK